MSVRGLLYRITGMNAGYVCYTTCHSSYCYDLLQLLADTEKAAGVLVHCKIEYSLFIYLLIC